MMLILLCYLTCKRYYLYPMIIYQMLLTNNFHLDTKHVYILLHELDFRFLIIFPMDLVPNKLYIVMWFCIGCVAFIKILVLIAGVL